MANVFTPILPNLTTGFQRVASERASLCRLAQTDFRAEQAAIGMSVTIPIAPVVVGLARTPAMIPTLAADRSVTNTSIAITKDQKYPFHMTGDDFLRIQQNPEFIPVSFQQAIRAWRNEVHSDLAGLHVASAGWYNTTGGTHGSAVGTAGTTPFAANIDTISDLKKAMEDSLAPLEDRFLMIDTSAERNLAKIGQLIKASEAGSDELLRQGIVGKLQGFNVIVDQDVKRWSPVGTGASYVANGVNAAGSLNLVVKTGTGTVLTGDVISVVSGGVTTLYTVATGIASAGTIVLTSGLIQATADNDVVTVIAASRRNMAFHREALGLAIRLPAMPPEGDAGDHATLVDAQSGLMCRISTYRGYGLNNYELSSAWGVKTVRPELLKLLLG